MRIFLCLLSVLLLLFTSVPMAVLAQESEGLISIPMTQEAPTIDGIWTNGGEWQDASETLMKDDESGYMAYLRTMHNKSHIFVLIDFVSDQSDNVNDRGSVGIGGVDDEYDPTSDDFWFTSKPAVYQGTGEGGLEFRSAWEEIATFPLVHVGEGFNGQNNPYEVENHKIYEFAISVDLIQPRNEYRFYASVQDKDSRVIIRWPSDVTEAPYLDTLGEHHPHTPTEWGAIISVDKSIPEFPQAFLIAGVGVVVAIIGSTIFLRTRSRPTTPT